MSPERSVTHVFGTDMNFLVSAAGLEPATHALKGISKSETKDLHDLLPSATYYAKWRSRQGFHGEVSQFAAIGRVWWYPQF